MNIRPFSWNVVLVGRWNLAILTPAGVAKHVFRLPPGQNLPVKVPLDGIHPYLIGHPDQQIEVAPESTRLLIQLEEMTYQALAAAMQMGSNVLNSLPETPVSAVGVNIKYHAEGDERDPTEVTPLVDHSSVDPAVCRARLEIVRRTVSRGLKYGPGVLNLDFTSDPDRFEVSFNFHKGDEDHSALTSWLEQDIGGIRTTVGKILNAVNLSVGEIGDTDE